MRRNSTQPASARNSNIANNINSFWDESKRLLSQDQVSALWLKYQENLGISEIAHTLDKSEANVKIFLFRARKALAKSNLLVDQHLTSQQANHQSIKPWKINATNTCSRFRIASTKIDPSQLIPRATSSNALDAQRV
ncbi:MAG: sigma-70 region 4 domain-containing protein [Rubritalea sp.]|uniref:RNA polymerase sigma factor n=1 Tax=Rubritalea sp. TaxID=2109375 RepID=UPI003241E8C1